MEKSLCIGFLVLVPDLVFAFGGNFITQGYMMTTLFWIPLLVIAGLFFPLPIKKFPKIGIFLIRITFVIILLFGNLILWNIIDRLIWLPQEWDTIEKMLSQYIFSWITSLLATLIIPLFIVDLYKMHRKSFKKNY